MVKLIEDLVVGDRIVVHGWQDKNNFRDEVVARKATVKDFQKKFITIHFDKGYDESWFPDKLGLAINGKQFDSDSLIRYEVLRKREIRRREMWH